MKIILTRKRGILRLLSVPDRYIKCKVSSVYRKLIKKRTKKTVDDVNNVEKLQQKSTDELKEMTKNWEELKIGVN